MKRTSIELDEELLARAQEVLGTKGVKATVERALEEVWRAHLRQRLLRRLETGEGLDLTPEVLEESRRWRG